MPALIDTKKGPQVHKRNGKSEPVDFDKIDRRLNWLSSHIGDRPAQLSVNASFVSMKVRDTVRDKVTTRELDEYATKVALEYGSIHPDYLTLAARIAIANHHKNTSVGFSNCIEVGYRNRKPNGMTAPRYNTKLYKFVQFHHRALNDMVDYDRDYRFSYLGFMKLMEQYLIKRSGNPDAVAARPQDFVIERPQDMWMRVACSIRMNRHNLRDASVLPSIKRLYDALSTGKIMLATPMLCNAGTNNEQYLSCFLLYGEDSREGINRINSNINIISASGGGIGWYWDLRSNRSEISSTNGTSCGPIPFLAITERGLQAFDQGGTRKGSGANYMCPSHPDFMKWVKLKRDGEADSLPKLFYSVWIPDEFMRRCDTDEMWYWADPHDCPELGRLTGDDWAREYRRIIEAGEYRGQPIRARDVMDAICETQIEKGVPYMGFADSINRKSNHKNLGKIRCSNLCHEIAEFSSADEYACCCLGTVCLPEMLVPCNCAEVCAERMVPDKMMWRVKGEARRHIVGCNGNIRPDWDMIHEYSALLQNVLDRVIDINDYPVPETKRSNERHRPIAIGVQGLADMFHLLWYVFTGRKARKVNKCVFESIYNGAIRGSIESARIAGPYSTYRGDPINNPNKPNELSPYAQGVLQFEMWGLKEEDLMGWWNWDHERDDMRTIGMRNSLVCAIPPTASTSAIQDNNECVEPYNANFVKRKMLGGEFLIVNRHLVRALIIAGLWNADIRAQIMAARGSIIGIRSIPVRIRKQFRTAFEMDGQKLLEMSAERAPFVDQTESANRFMTAPSKDKLVAMHMTAWRLGLKTGMYYLRTKALSRAAQLSEAVVRNIKKGAVISPGLQPVSDPDLVEDAPLPTCARTLNEETGEWEHDCCGV